MNKESEIVAGRKLLLADDSITIQKVIKLSFADEGVEVVSVGDGDEAVQRVAEVNPDIVLADVNMPGLNGYQVCERIRSDGRTRHIPVVLLVGAFEQFDDAEAVRVGANAHITKPFHSIRQLINLVLDQMNSNRPAEVPTSDQTSGAEDQPQPIDFTVPAATSSSPFDSPIVSSYFDPKHEPAPTPKADHAEQDPARQDVESDPLVPEPEDIDHLYRQSIGSEPISDGHELPDLGIDDEMIETSYTAPQAAADEFDLVPPYSSEQSGDVSAAERPGVASEFEETIRSPYETSDLNVSDLPAAAPSPDARALLGETERLDPAIVDARMAEVNRQFEPQAAGVGQAEVEAARSRDEIVAVAPVIDRHEASPAPFDDSDLLDIPDGTELEVAPPADIEEEGSPKFVVTLSPETIEMIAQRVVEKLSERR